MRLPLSLIKSFISSDLNVQKIEQTLTSLGIEVDAIESMLPPFQNVVVGEVKSVARHPAADKLQIAQVFDGSQTVQIVCGAPNCRPGLRVAFAKVGATLTPIVGEKLFIQKGSIRGVDSFGMLCSATELGLYEDHSGILELPSEYAIGADCLPLLWDPLFEISLTPNLGHCMSALGIARELSAALQLPLNFSHKKLHPEGEKKILVKVENRAICARYTAQLIEHVKIAPSPFWLQKQLKSAGVRPINNVVDVTNYMLLKYGQPMHAFDFQKIEGSLSVERLQREESFAGLDGNLWEVPAQTVVIRDEKKTVALAGILGGSNSAVTDETHTILLESASFDSMSVRTSSKKMGLRTESSYRFEKGVDPSTVSLFLNEAAHLIVEISGGKLSERIIDTHPNPFPPRTISCRPARVNQVLGTLLSLSEIESIFHRLGFTTNSQNGSLLVNVPLYRNDVQEEIDLVEEVARIYGYQNIERSLPKATSPQIPHDPEYLFETEIRRRLVGLGLTEFLSCDLISPKLAEIAQELSHSKTVLLQTLHSKSEEYSVLRPSLLPGLLQATKHNLDQKNHSFQAFELGRIHFKQDEKPVEFPMASIVLTGKTDPHHWRDKPDDCDFFELKGIVENLLISLRISSPLFVPSKHPSFHPGRQADLIIGDLVIGSIGEVHPNLLAKFDIKQKVYYAELNGQFLRKLQHRPPQMKPLPLFPSSERDWTVSLPKTTYVAELLSKIRTHAPSLLESFELIDLFHKEEQSNVTFRFVYRDLAKTVSFEEVEKAHAELLSKL